MHCAGLLADGIRPQWARGAGVATIGSRRVSITGEGRFETLTYAMADDDTLGTCFRTLTVEFRDDIFNAYLSGSSCSVDETQANTAAAEEVRARIGSATREGAIALLDKPSGNAICPSEITAFKEMCRDAAQVLAWFSLPSQGFGGGADMIMKIVVVAIDAHGKVQDVRVEERSDSL